MTTIYVVTEGSYSDYHIVGVYDNKELAEQFLKNIDEVKKYNDMQIEEYELNQNSDKIKQGLMLYSVQMERDGTGDSFLYSNGDESPLQLNEFYPKRLYGCIWAHNEEHAIKIANEKRAQLIALNQWE